MKIIKLLYLKYSLSFSICLISSFVIFFIFSLLGNLNEDYEGSEFHCRDKEIKLKTGDILMFPSNFMYPHEVTECTKGTRYSFVSWAF